MTNLLRSLLKRILSLIATLFIITALLYATVMLTPAETRATLFMPKNVSAHQTEEQYQHMLELIIEQNHLNDSYPVQYYYWLTNLVRGNWGYSPTLHEDVLAGIIRRTPATAELTLYSILVFIPLGLISGLLAGFRKNKPSDHAFRFSAYAVTTLPPFILALLLMAIFYVGLHWFSPERMSSAVSYLVNSDGFRQYSGFLTIDGLLNGRWDVTWDALRHLAMPVFTLAIAHWATLGRVTRAATVEEMNQDYVLAARARGLSEGRILFHHTLGNVISPAFTSSVLSAAALMTGVFVVEIIFTFHGVSEIAVASMSFIPDAASALGFAIYNVIIVWVLMGILDLFQFSLDPRMRGVG